MRKDVCNVRGCVLERLSSKSKLGEPSVITMRYRFPFAFIGAALGYPRLQNQKIAAVETAVADTCVNNGTGYVHRCNIILLYNRPRLPYAARRIFIAECHTLGADSDVLPSWGSAQRLFCIAVVVLK